MAIYLGESGSVELRRDSLNAPLVVSISPDDVNETKRRFSFDSALGTIITGDQLEIAAVTGSTLTFISTASSNTWEGFVHVDSVGGLKLYTSFQDAIAGEASNAIVLITPTGTEDVTVSTTGNSFRCLAQVQNFELTDSRETVDITSIGEEFRRNYANGLISGQGSMACFWEYESSQCDSEYGTNVEFPHYLAQLVIRLRQGADFIGRFFIHTDENTAVWQEATCIVTNVALTVTPAALIQTNIQFVTTGEIRLLVGTPPAFLLQENAFEILAENGEGLGIENDD